MEHEGNGDTNYNWCTCNGPQGLGKGSRKVGSRRTNRENSAYSIVRIAKNTEKRHGDLGSS